MGVTAFVLSLALTACTGPALGFFRHDDDDAASTRAVSSQTAWSQTTSSHNSSAQTSSANRDSPAETATDQTGEPSTRPEGVPSDWIRVPLNNLPDSRQLELVNADHPAPADPGPLLDVADAAPTMFNGIRLNPVALTAIVDMFAAAARENAGPFVVTSGFRTAERQAELWESATDRSLVKPPGHSEHQIGFAIDIQAQGLHQNFLAASPHGQWLAENAPRFGLILRYPEGKEHLTGVAFEPWHFRYVGQPHASEITARGIVLEEYLDWLRATGSYIAEVNGVHYFVSYQTTVADEIWVPASGDFRVSNTNRGTYIVTAW